MEEIYGPQLEEEQQTASVYEYQNTPENRSWAGALPVKQGLYDPEYEKDACGVGFAASVPCTFPFMRDRSLIVPQPYQGPSKPQDYQRW